MPIRAAMSGFEGRYVLVSAKQVLACVPGRTKLGDPSQRVESGTELMPAGGVDITPIRLSLPISMPPRT